MNCTQKNFIVPPMQNKNVKILLYFVFSQRYRRNIYHLYVEYDFFREFYWGLIPKFLPCIFPFTFGKYCRDVLETLQSCQKLTNIKIVFFFLDSRLYWVCMAKSWKRGGQRSDFCEKPVEASPSSNGANARQLQGRPITGQG